MFLFLFSLRVFKSRYGELNEIRQQKKYQKTLVEWEQEREKALAKEKLFKSHHKGAKEGEGEEKEEKEVGEWERMNPPPSLPSFEVPDEWQQIGNEATHNKVIICIYIYINSWR